MKNKKVISVLLISICMFELNAQQTITSTGGNSTGIGGSVSYSVGQLFYQTTSSAGGSVRNGVQQPYEIYELSSLEEANKISLKLSMYPNPTSNYLTLKVENYTTENLTFQLSDINGKLLLMGKLNGPETPILIETLTKGSYFLKVNNKQTELKTFKIIKN
jgi:hypothetical protein